MTFVFARSKNGLFVNINVRKNHFQNMFRFKFFSQKFVQSLVRATSELPSWTSCFVPKFRLFLAVREPKQKQVNLPKNNVVVQQTKSLQPNEKQFCWLWVVVFTFFSNGEMSLAFFQVVFPIKWKNYSFSNCGKNYSFSNWVEKQDFFQPSGKTRVFPTKWKNWSVFFLK